MRSYDMTRDIHIYTAFDITIDKHEFTSLKVVELELALKTQLSCIRDFQLEQDTALELEFTLDELAVALALREELVRANAPLRRRKK